MTVTVLVVDDNTLVAMAAVDMLEGLGYTAYEAHSGAEALDVLRTHDEIEVMLTDLRMPGITGTQLAASAHAIRPDLPVIVTSGDVDARSGQHEGLPALAKPYNRQQLDALLRQIVAQARTTAAAQTEAAS